MTTPSTTAIHTTPATLTRKDFAMTTTTHASTTAIAHYVATSFATLTVDGPGAARRPCEVFGFRLQSGSGSSAKLRGGG
jgi:hypothetical protein